VFLKLVVAITGASGVIYGKRLLEVLKEKNVETHLIISRIATKLIEYELGTKLENVEKLAAHAYSADDLFAPVASGSFKTDGMVIIPCSMKTMAGIANGYSDNLILRAAEVALKEKRKLILVPRETPLSSIHINNMLKLSRLGAIIVPAMPAYYHKPKDIDDLVDFIVGKVLDLLGIEHKLFKRWRES
jgi:4-hydroxy-3-polyprenylbenzoate decarboxylase